MHQIHFIINILATCLSLIGVFIIIVGAFFYIGKSALEMMQGLSTEKSFKHLRNGLGKSILLGLEILVAADIIATVTTTPTIESVSALAIIIVIRTLLSFSLHVEIDGKLPWQKK